MNEASAIDTVEAQKTVPVALPGREYDIAIGGGLLAGMTELVRPLLKRPRVVIVTDTHVGQLYLEKMIAGFRDAGIRTHGLTLPAGEATKSWLALQEVTEWLLGQEIERDDIVIALGGGVIGDLVGFSAAILRRGVRFVQVPTSLLAQVDSAVGGKTGINSQSGKNLVGAFHQPSLVVSDIDVLKTLPMRDFLSGYGEVVKYGLLGDADFFAKLESRADDIRARDPALLTEIVAHSCQMKADIVLRDEKEHGDRALLNLGHTFGHALERATGYSSRLLHGEAVAIGCVLAFELSAELGVGDPNAAARVRAHLDALGMRSKINQIPGELPPPEKLLEAMYQDKKVQSGALTFILARNIGEAFVQRDVDPAPILAVLSKK